MYRKQEDVLFIYLFIHLFIRDLFEDAVSTLQPPGGGTGLESLCKEVIVA
jgi:hypothetical protein